MTEVSSLDQKSQSSIHQSSPGNRDIVLISPQSEIRKKSAVIDNYDVQLERAKFMNIMSSRKQMLN